MMLIKILLSFLWSSSLKDTIISAKEYEGLRFEILKETSVNSMTSFVYLVFNVKMCFDSHIYIAF